MGDTTNMKFFVLACLVAAAYAEAEPKAEAEADPALLYSTYGYGYPSVYSGLHHPYVYGSYYRPYGGYHYLGKRSAEAEPTAEATADPEADPYLLYGYGYPHAYGYAGLHHPYAYSAYHYRPYGCLLGISDYLNQAKKKNIKENQVP